MPNKQVLVTGAAGYVGAVLCRQLLDAGHAVVGMDKLLFGGQSLWNLAAHPNFKFMKGDLCDFAWDYNQVQKFDCVVHLAAIVGDPACKKFPEEATALMDVASKRLFQVCKDAGVRHFIFASTCSNYGIMEGDALLDENSPLLPQSHYAKLKVGFERFLMDHSSALPWTILRFATAFGHSSRPRFDLTVNHFCKDMSLSRPLTVFAADSWRPYCHVEDLASAVALCVDLGPDHLSSMVFNVGSNDMNFNKKDIVAAIRPWAPQAPVFFNSDSGGDNRNYRVDFRSFTEKTGFKPSQRLEDGIRETIEFVREGLLENPDDARFHNA
jgi:nucleoside-diphosphate-sugar epimerase